MKQNHPDPFDSCLRDNLSGAAPAGVHEQSRKHFKSLAASLERRQTASAISGRDGRDWLFAFVRTLWRELIWSGRRAWVGYAAVWLVIVVVNLTGSDRATATDAKSKPPPAAMLMALREQERLLVELMEQTESKVAEPPKPSVPRPRSERPGGWTTV